MDVDIKLTDKQIEFLESSYQYPLVFFGGAKAGGKSYGLRNIILIRVMEQKVTAAIFRKTYPELSSNIIEPLLAEHPWLNKYYNKSEHKIRLPDGGGIDFCHLQNPDDVTLYQGREYPIIGVEEAGQWDEGTFQTLAGCSRTSIPGVKPVILLTGNPGGVGHAWLKRLFINRQFKPMERPEDYKFISARVYDCPPLIQNNPQYLNRLEAEPNETLRRAYLDGDWDVFAGQFFNEWRHEVHTCKPFDIPDHWIRFAAFDPGFFHPAAFGWFASDETGRTYLYREIIEPGLRIDELAQLIWEHKDTKKLTAIFAGKDCWSHGRDGGPTIAEQFSSLPPNMRLYLSEANTDRVQGAAQVRSYLAWQKLPSGMTGPRLQIFNTCHKTIETLPRLIHDPKRPEDVLKMDASENDRYGGDDCYDMVRYALMSRPSAAKVVNNEYIPKTSEQKVHEWQEKRRRALMRQRNGSMRDETLGGTW